MIRTMLGNGVLSYNIYCNRTVRLNGIVVVVVKKGLGHNLCPSLGYRPSNREQ